MIFKRIDELSNELIESWGQFIRIHPNSSFFQSPDFYNLSKEYSLSAPVGIVSIHDGLVNGVLLGILLREKKLPDRFFSSRIIIWGGPIVLQNNKELTEELIKSFTFFYKHSSIYIQFRNLFIIENQTIFKEFGYKFEDHLNIHIDLKKPLNDIWNEIHSKRRNEIRKAYKCQIKVNLVTTIEDFKESYNILKEVYSRAKLPLLPFEYFNLAWNKLYSDGILKIFGAYYNNKLIGTMYVLAFKDNYYDWYAGSYYEYYNKNPNDILPWEVFKYAQENGVHLFDFGGAGHPNQSYGVRDYKQKFGGNTINTGRFIRVNKPFVYMIGKLGLKIWKLLR